MSSFFPFTFSLDISKSHTIILSMMRKKQMGTVWVLSPSRPLLTLFHILYICSIGKRRILHNFSTNLIIISNFLFSLVYIHYKLFKLTPLKWLSRNKLKPKKAFTTSFFWYMVAINKIAGGGGCGAVRGDSYLQFLKFFQI